MERLEQGVKYVQIPCSRASIVNFEKLIAGWVKSLSVFEEKIDLRMFRQIVSLPMT